MSSSSSSSSSSSPPVAPQHCSNIHTTHVSVLYESLKYEEEPCRMWLRDEMNQIPEPLIDSLFHGLICSSSSSSAVGQSRPTVSELCELLEGEKVQLRMVLRGEMDRLVNTLFDRLTNKLKTNLDREEDGDDRAQGGQVEQPTPQPSTSSFNPVAHPQHSNGDEVQLNTVEMIEIKEEVEDGEETRIIDMETLTEDRQVKREIEQDGEMTLLNDEDWVKREIKEEEEDEEMVEVKEEIKEEDEEERNGEAEIDDIEGWAESNQSGDDECQALDNVPLNTTLTHPTGQSQLTVTQSADLLSPSTSTAQDSNRTALNQKATVLTHHKVTKRKQQTSKLSAKRSKPTIEEDDGEDGEDIANEDREESKIKILNLNCTQSNCNVKLDSMVHLHDHLSTVHQLSPLECFATNCNARFDNRQQMLAHIKQSHSRNSRFICSVCPKEYSSQHKTYIHWYRNHQTGQFKCNFVSDCAQVTDTRRKMTTHHQTKHHSQSKRFNCIHPGCTASFFSNGHLKQHQQIHLATNQFHCNWPHCSKQFKLRKNLVRHIRTQHFGLPKSMKAQKERNIVDLRDPNEYVRVVVDE